MVLQHFGLWSEAIMRTDFRFLTSVSNLSVDSSHHLDSCSFSSWFILPLLWICQSCPTLSQSPLHFPVYHVILISHQSRKDEGSKYIKHDCCAILHHVCNDNHDLNTYIIDYYLFCQLLHWRRQLWGTGARVPSTYNNFFFSALWPVQSLTATICRQLPPVKMQ